MPRQTNKLYTVFDTVAEICIGPVVPALNDQMASREFAKWVTQGELKNNPQDYRLLRVGTIGDFGDVIAEDPAVVITGSAVVATLQERGQS